MLDQTKTGNMRTIGRRPPTPEQPIFGQQCNFLPNARLRKPGSPFSRFPRPGRLPTRETSVAEFHCHRVFQQLHPVWQDPSSSESVVRLQSIWEPQRHIRQHILHRNALSSPTCSCPISPCTRVCRFPEERLQDNDRQGTIWDPQEAFVSPNGLTKFESSVSTTTDRGTHHFLRNAGGFPEFQYRRVAADDTIVSPEDAHRDSDRMVYVQPAPSIEADDLQ